MSFFKCGAFVFSVFSFFVHVFNQFALFAPCKSLSISQEVSLYI